MFSQVILNLLPASLPPPSTHRQHLSLPARGLLRKKGFDLLSRLRCVPSKASNGKRCAGAEDEKTRFSSVCWGCHLLYSPFVKGDGAIWLLSFFSLSFFLLLLQIWTNHFMVSWIDRKDGDNGQLKHVNPNGQRTGRTADWVHGVREAKSGRKQEQGTKPRGSD